jgi:hypothetical protein
MLQIDFGKVILLFIQHAITLFFWNFVFNLIYNRVYMTLTVKHFKKIAIFDSTSVIAEELISQDLLKLAKKVTEWGK